VRGCRTPPDLACRGRTCNAATLSQDGGYRDGWVGVEAEIIAWGMRGSGEAPRRGERRNAWLGGAPGSGSVERGRTDSLIQAALRFFPPGTSAGSIRPTLIQPTHNNHDWADETSHKCAPRKSSGSKFQSKIGATQRNPPNQRPEEAGSICTGGAKPLHSQWCLRWLRSTYERALRTSRGLLSTRRW